MSCVSLLLLLCLLLMAAALDPFPAAAAHREVLMVATGNEDAKLDRTTETMAKDLEDAATRKRNDRESTRWHHFRTRKIPSDDAKNRFGGRAPFTADYSGIQSSPSKHH